MIVAGWILVTSVGLTSGGASIPQHVFADQQSCNSVRAVFDSRYLHCVQVNVFVKGSK